MGMSAIPSCFMFQCFSKGSPPFFDLNLFIIHWTVRLASHPNLHQANFTICLLMSDFAQSRLWAIIGKHPKLSTK
jgi:hypothetical protein